MGRASNGPAAVAIEGFSELMGGRRGRRLAEPWLVTEPTPEQAAMAEPFQDLIRRGHYASPLTHLQSHSQYLDRPLLRELTSVLADHVWAQTEEGFDQHLKELVKDARLRRHGSANSPDNFYSDALDAELRQALRAATARHLAEAIRGRGQAGLWGRRPTSPNRGAATLKVEPLAVDELKGIADYVNHHELPRFLAERIAARPEVARSVIARALYGPDHARWSAMYGQPELADLCTQADWERALGKVWQYFNSDRAPLGACGHLDDNLIRRRLVDMERQLTPEERREAQELIREAQLPVWGGEPGRRRGLDDAARARLRELGERSAAAYQAQRERLRKSIAL